MQIAWLFLQLAVVFVKFSSSSELWCTTNENKSNSQEELGDLLCYNELNETFYQDCISRKHHASTCSFHSYGEGRMRLKDFFHGDNFLYFNIANPSPWNKRSCFGSESTLLDLSKSELRYILNYMVEKQNSSRFWIPARRRKSSFGPIVWSLPGKIWGDVISENYDELSPLDCVSVVVDFDFKLQLMMRNCSEPLQMLCVYKDSPLLPLSCPQGYVALRSAPNKCYSIYWGSSPQIDLDYESVVDMQKSNILSLVTSYFNIKDGERCLVYQNRAQNVTISFNSTGDLKFSGFHSNCALSVHTIPFVEDTVMFLSFNPNIETLLLTVYNRNQIWCGDEDKDKCGIKCFTNAEYEQIYPVKIKNLVWEDGRKSIFELKLYGDGPGYYWCEAHTIHDFDLVTSPKIVATKKQKGHSFAFFFNLPCNVMKCNKIHDNMKYFGKSIKSILEHAKQGKIVRNKFKILEIYSVRVMNVEVLVPNSFMQVLCHATVYLKGSSVDNGSEEEDDDDYPQEGLHKLEYDIKVRHDMQRLLRDLINTTSYAPSDVVNSTEYCFPETSITLDRKWQPAKLGMSTTTFEMCLLRNGLPIFRKCVGNFLYGAMWEPIDPKMKCTPKITGKPLTSNLYEIDRGKLAKKQPSKVIKNVESLVNETKSLIPADLFYLGRIMQTVAKSVAKKMKLEQNGNNQTQWSFDDLNSTEAIIRIYNYLMDVDQRIIKSSVKLNSTNILLDAFESIINEISVSNGSLTNLNRSNLNDDARDDGVIIHRTPKLLAFIIDPSVNNISGIALFSNSDEDDFRDSNIRLLSSNQSVEELLEEDNLEIAAFVPQTLLERLDEIPSRINETLLFTRPPIKVVIKVYFNDRLFQEDRDIVDNMVFSKIISISLPGYDPVLPEQLPLLMKTHYTSENETEDSCRYWNYNTWAEDGLEFVRRSTSNKVIQCGCSHLTPFAYLVGGSYNLSVSSDLVIITELHREALDMITVLGCSLSLVGIIGIIITAIIFKRWREKATSKVILNFSIAIGLQMILFCFVNTDVLTTHLIQNQIFSSCILLGACLHYFVLVQFSWMLIIAYLQFKRYVQVLGNTRPPRFFFKAFLLGWCLPLLPVFLVVLVDKESYIPLDNRDSSQICYPSGQALYFGVIFPICAIIAANLVIFLLVSYNIVRGPKEKIRPVDRSFALSQVRLSILLFFLLGFTWIFGLFAAAKVSLVFSYLFCLTATLQGFVLFIYFVILDPVTRNMWSSFLKKVFCKSEGK